MPALPNKFTVGESVLVTHEGTLAVSSRGTYTLIRVLPRERDGWQYHIQSAHDQHVRRVYEEQLRPLVPSSHDAG